MADGLHFIRKNGHIIPIRPGGGNGGARAKFAGKALKGARAATGVAGAVAAARSIKKTGKSNPAIKVNSKFNMLGIGLSAASGVVAAATFGLGAKGFIAGQVASEAVNAASIAANVRSVAGKGNLKGRVEQGAKQEARNVLIGYGVYGAGVLGFKSNRQAGIAGIKKGAAYAQKVLSIGRKALRVV